MTNEFSFLFVVNRLYIATGPPSTAVSKRIRAYAIYGIFKLLRGPYLAVATDVRYTAPAPHGGSIYRITKMEWFPVGVSPSRALTSTEEEEENVYLSLLKLIADTQSFYFGYNYNVVNSMQRNEKNLSVTNNDNGNSNNTSNNPTLGNGNLSSSNMNTLTPENEPFFWNRSAASSIMEANANDFLTPIMNGFVGSIDVSPDFDFTLVLISRRASARQGTRFNVRGSDNDGNVANFVETEQLILFGTGTISSFLQIRGSIPLLWDQSPTAKYTPRCTLSDKKMRSLDAFQRHMDTITKRYERIAVVNLIDRKGDQLALGNAYEEACRWLNSHKVSFTWFDFHGKCKKTWETLRELVDSMEKTLVESSYFMKDAQGKVLSEQHGVVRTNCMDNLDRTNVVQSLFARHAALAPIPGALDRAKTGKTLLSSTYAVFDTKFNNLWADNADAISILYSGTHALKTDFTRTGKRVYLIGKLAVGDLQDGYYSVKRYLLNNFSDGRTQDAWDLFVGNYVPERIRPGVLESKTKFLAPIRHHMNELTPMGVLTRVTIIFVGITIAIASLVTKSDTPLLNRAAWGMFGASLVIGGLSFLILGKGKLYPLAKTVISKPRLCPPVPVTAPDSNSTSNSASISTAGSKLN